MLKNITQLEHKIGDRVFHFLCDPLSPLSEVKDALLKFVQYVGQIEDQAKAQKEAEEKLKPEIKVEEPPEA